VTSLVLIDRALPTMFAITLDASESNEGEHHHVDRAFSSV